MSWKFVSGEPVYVQIARKLKSDILAGKYSADAPFPSVRQLALEAKVNPNTMQRALSALEDEGLLVSRSTAGRFVTSEQAAIETEKKRTIETETEQLLTRIKSLGVTKAQLIKMIEEREEWNDDRT